jgi:hypothetical protein
MSPIIIIIIPPDQCLPSSKDLWNSPLVAAILKFSRSLTSRQHWMKDDLVNDSFSTLTSDLGLLIGAIVVARGVAAQICYERSL